ncbi:hypothetical protein [Corynebacterium atrinae]|uniref:hypothetical protein n=1 Tax=Corynebacterium atrinae TaxID=1336740 RepID=UPI0025B426E0|nr:hypothetical protein [Corynebacterium atrinae]
MEPAKEPLWDFSRSVEPLVPAALPYSLDDEEYLGFLTSHFSYVAQLCLPPCARNGDKSFRWKDIAEELGNDFTLGVSFWSAIGVEDERSIEALTHRFNEPYFGMLYLAEWWPLRQVFGLPEAGICYSDFIMYGDDGPGPIPGEEILVRTSEHGYRYFSGRCVGETSEEIFSPESGTSACWVAGEWFVAVDVDLTRGTICFNSKTYLERLIEDGSLEFYLLQSPSR